jgi:hypothetical protein
VKNGDRTDEQDDHLCLGHGGLLRRAPGLACLVPTLPR